MRCKYPLKLGFRSPCASFLRQLSALVSSLFVGVASLGIVDKVEVLAPATSFYLEAPVGAAGVRPGALADLTRQQLTENREFRNLDAGCRFVPHLASPVAQCPGTLAT